MGTSFVHLHVHSQYSLLDGQASIPAMFEKAIATGMPGLALTDHGNMFGIKEFHNYAKKRNSKTKGAMAALEEELKDADDSKRAEIEAKIAKLRGELVKPIFGCEVYVANEDLHTNTDKNDRGRHLILLAKNKTGYSNLIKIVSQAWTEGFYSHPRTDKQAIAAHKEGLIVCSACLGGEVPRLIAAGELDKAEQAVLWWKETFGDDYYIEVQRHPTNKPGGNREVYEVQQIVNPELIRLATKHGIKIVATNDSHFVDEGDAEAHDRLICISTGTNVADEKRMHYTKQEWLKTPDEMAALFTDYPEAISNTLEILDKVEEYSIDHGPIMPNFQIPEEFGTEAAYREKYTEEDLFNEFTRDECGNVVLDEKAANEKIKKLGGYDKLYRIKFEADYLRKLAYEGAERRYGNPLPDDINERINFELHIMKTMGFPGYFLIVQDFINAARHQLGVSVGPGRGSAAGSCVAYCLGITQIDPVKYDLLFERFLNPDRISLPDIDIDFDDDGRADVLRYVTDKYGEEKVAHIITYGTMATKMAIKDVARVEGLSVSESDRLTKLVPKRMPVVDGKELKLNLGNCLKYVPEFQAELNGRNEDIKRTLEFARQLEGNIRNTGVHACGVIICRDDITDWVPVSTAVDKGTDGKNDKVIVTQYEGSVIEETGLIKMDFLGLKTLSIIKEAIDNIRLTRGIDIDSDAIPIDDPKTYQLYCEGRTTGTFQFESAGMQKYLRELQPSTFEDLIAMNALYRPGPMDYIPDFIARKHGRTPVTYDIPIMEKYLKDTYGVTVYQEQVMLLSRLLANFTRGESDTLRKAMGKKLIDKMKDLEKEFLKRGQANGHNPETLKKIWADWEKFASYAFNKSHATCYSWVAFQTAYLKANYPAEFMAAVLTRNSTDVTKLTVFMEECKKMHIRILGPDINESFSQFGVNSKGDIRFGLKAIKGVGDNLVADILAARNEGGEFKDIYDFIERIPLSAMNRRNLESLAMAGAFDCFKSHIKREDFFFPNPKGESFSEALLRYGQRIKEDKQNQGFSLFGDDEDAMCTAGRPEVLSAPLWSDIKRLEEERALVGLYLSAHPLDPYYMDLRYGCVQLKDFNENGMPGVAEGEPIRLGGMVVGAEKATTKRGDPFMRLKVEDFSGAHDFALFGQNYYTYQGFCEPGTKLLITGSWTRRFKNSDPRFEISKIEVLDNLKGKLATSLELRVGMEQLTDALLGLLTEHMKTEVTGENDKPLTFNLYDPESRKQIRLITQSKIRLSRGLLEGLDEMSVEYRVDA